MSAPTETVPATTVEEPKVDVPTVVEPTPEVATEVCSLLISIFVLTPRILINFPTRHLLLSLL